MSFETAQDDRTAALIDACLKARERSYSPYSKFRVGAALRTTSGEVFTGCNIENAAFTPTVCAERVAMSTAVAAGFKTFDTIAISSDVADTPIVPCGVCRQFLREFCKELEMLLVRPDGTFVRSSLSKLLPESFGPEWL